MAAPSPNTHAVTQHRGSVPRVRAAGRPARRACRRAGSRRSRPVPPRRPTSHLQQPPEAPGDSPQRADRTVAAVATGAAASAATSTAAQIATPRPTGRLLAPCRPPTAATPAAGCRTSGRSARSPPPVSLPWTSTPPATRPRTPARSTATNSRPRLAEQLPGRHRLRARRPERLRRRHRPRPRLPRPQPDRRHIAYWQTGRPATRARRPTSTAPSSPCSPWPARRPRPAAPAYRRRCSTCRSRIRNNQHNDGGWTFRGRGQPHRTRRGQRHRHDGRRHGRALRRRCPQHRHRHRPGEELPQGQARRRTGGVQLMFGVNTDSNGWAVSRPNACGIPARAATSPPPPARPRSTSCAPSSSSPAAASSTCTTRHHPRPTPPSTRCGPVAGAGLHRRAPDPGHRRRAHLGRGERIHRRAPPPGSS